MESILFFSFIIIGFIYLIHVALYIVGANIYDIKKLYAKYQNPAEKLQWRRTLPTVSVLIPVYNEELMIERCLSSVVNSTYAKLQIIVINDNSTDNTLKIINRFTEEHPESNITLINRTANQGKASGLNYALGNIAKGDFVMTLDGDSVLDGDAIQNAIQYFDDPKLAGLAANVRVMNEASWMNILQTFEYMAAYRSKKLYSLANCEFIIGGVGSIYRRSVIKRFGYYDTDNATEDIALSMKITSSGNLNYKLIYASDVVAYTESVPNLKGLLKQRYRWKYGNLQSLIRYSKVFYTNRKSQSKSMLYYRLPMAYLSELLLILEPWLFSYAIFILVRASSLVVFISAYLLTLLYMNMVVFSDEYLSNSRKLRMAAYIPTLYFLFYLMSIVQISAVFKCLYNLPSIINSDQTTSVWTPSSRSGKSVISN